MVAGFVSVASALLLYGFGWGVSFAITTLISYNKNNLTTFNAIMRGSLGLQIAAVCGIAGVQFAMLIYS